MHTRIGAVCWWTGAVIDAAIVLLTTIAWFNEPNDLLLFLTVGTVALLLVTGIAWGLAFIFGGSFWRPPQQGYAGIELVKLR